MSSQPSEPVLLSEDDLVTGEAVAIELPPATIGMRLAAGIIDVVLSYLTLILLFLVLLWAASVATPRNFEAFFAIASVLTVATSFLLLPTAIGTLTRGKSLGKWIFGLRVVRNDGGPISFHHAFVRALIGVVEIFAFSGGPAVLAVIMSKAGRRLGDQAAGTYVIRERISLPVQPLRQLPPPLTGWAATADVAALPTGLAIAVRQFLQRAPSLAAETRTGLAGQLADRVAAYAAPPPPVGTPAEAFLTAVMVIRREKVAARLRAEAELRRRLSRSLTPEA